MVPFKLDEHRFAQSVRSARRGAHRHEQRTHSLVESIPFPVAFVCSMESTDLWRTTVQDSLRPTAIAAFPDNVHTVITPKRVAQFRHSPEHLHRHQHPTLKIKVCNATGVRPRSCDTLQTITTSARSLEPMWKRLGLVTVEQGIKVLGTPLGHEDFVAAHLHLRNHQTLLERIPILQDIQIHKSALRTKQAAYWASGVDTLSLVRGGLRAVADAMVTSLTDGIDWSPRTHNNNSTGSVRNND